MQKENRHLKYCVHNEEQIFGFFGDYRYLSNFHICPIEYLGDEFLSTEAAFQAAKSPDPEVRAKFKLISPNEAKKLGQSILIRTDWQSVKEDIMFYINLQKYSRNKGLRQLLINTGHKRLIEGNDWGDVVWGTSAIEKFFEKHNRVIKIGEGENKLGLILERVRKIIC